MTDTTSNKKIIEVIISAHSNDEESGICGWEIAILRGKGTDQEKIIKLHAHLEKRITDLVDDKDSNEFEGDFYNVLELAIQRNMTLPDVYQY